MADAVKGSDRALSVFMRLVVSLVLPLWALAMLVVGVSYGAGWWIACGLVVGAIGVVMLAGSPLGAAFSRER
jgi:hypothetical protein